jgi:hypothetical protein
MKYVKSYAIFEQEEWTFDEVQRMLDSGLMTLDEALPTLRKAIRTELAKAGTNDPWSPEGREVLRAFPVVAAVDEPEAQPFFDAGWKPDSSIVQIAQGTLQWKKVKEYPNATPPAVRLQYLVFYDRTGYVRSSVGSSQPVTLFKVTPGQGLAFFKSMMAATVEKYSIVDLVQSHKSLATDRGRADVRQKVLDKLQPLFGEHTKLLKYYIDTQLIKAFGLKSEAVADKIVAGWPGLPLWIIDSIVLDTAASTGVPAGAKFWMAKSIKLDNSWSGYFVRKFEELREAGLVDEEKTKPFR